MIIISDTDFLSSLLKISRLEIVRDLFNEENVHIPVAVLSEVAKTELITDLLSKDWIRVRKVKEGDLRKMERDKEFANLGSGEKECIVLCKQVRGSILLISDNKAGEIANKNGI
jgi:predicted nucleic acid-binding protein